MAWNKLYSARYSSLIHTTIYYCPSLGGWVGLEQAVQCWPVRYLARGTWVYGAAGQPWPELSRGRLIC